MMKVSRKIKWNQKGFTIIETIIALAMVSIVAAMLYTFSSSLYNSAGAFIWLNDELTLQQSAESIVADYKNKRNDPANPYDPAVFRQYVIDHYSLVDSSKTGFITFTFTSGTTYTAGWPPQTSIPAGNDPPVLIVTLQKNQRSLAMIFT